MQDPEQATPLCPCNGVFTDQFIVRLISANFDYHISATNPLATTGDKTIVFLMF